MKKAFYILTAILLLLTAMIPVSAIEEVEPQAACEHCFAETYSVKHCLSRDDKEHQMAFDKETMCIYCGQIQQMRLWYGARENHQKRYIHAECNGTTQTHNLRCDTCHTDFTETIRCPNAPHGVRPCVALPLRQIFEVA